MYRNAEVKNENRKRNQPSKEYDLDSVVDWYYNSSVYRKELVRYGNGIHSGPQYKKKRQNANY